MGKNCGCQKKSTKNLAKNHNPQGAVGPCKYETKLSAQLQYATGVVWSYSLSTSQNGDTCEEAKANSEAAATGAFGAFVKTHQPKIINASYSLVSACINNCDSTPWTLEAKLPATYTLTPTGAGELYDAAISIYPFENAPTAFVITAAEGVSLAGAAALATRSINFTMSNTSIDADLTIGSGPGAVLRKVTVRLDDKNINNAAAGNVQLAAITEGFTGKIEPQTINIAFPITLSLTTIDEEGTNRVLELNSLQGLFGGFGSEKGVKEAVISGQTTVVLLADGLWAP